MKIRRWFTSIVSIICLLTGPFFIEWCGWLVGKAGISALVKCTSVIRQLAYAAVPDSLDEYLQIGEKTSRDCLIHFCNGVIELYGEEYLRRPKQTDVAENSIRAGFSREKNLGFRYDIGSLKRGLNIYSEWAVLMKSISQPWSNDVQRIRYKQAHEAARKDVERAFDVLKKKWAIVRTPARSRSFKWITHLMYTCIILHNMIRQNKKRRSLANIIRKKNIVKMIQ
ncbi:protein translocase subunit SecA2, chloroplastic isoform X1 [Tanacetum coccineum]